MNDDQQSETITEGSAGALALQDEQSDGSILDVIARAARDPNVDVDKLERLLNMQERVLMRGAEREFNDAMRKTQEKIRPVVRNRSNDSTNSKFADLTAISDAIDPIIHNAGFSLSYGSEESPLPQHYRVTCLVSHTGGFSRNYSADVPSDNLGMKGAPTKTMTHGWGSAMTYGRRYLKMLIFDVKLLDDDGNSAGTQPINEEQVACIEGLIKVVNADRVKFLKFCKIDAIEQLDVAKYDRALAALRQVNPDAAKRFLTDER